MVSNEQFLLSHSLHVNELKTKILPYRQQEKIRNEWLKERMDTILPQIMKENNMDMWVIACNEYNEDPILFSLLPVALFTARRCMVLVFSLEDGEVKRYALTRPHIGIDDYYDCIWTNQKGGAWESDPATSQTQWECLSSLVKRLDPKTIGLNYSEHSAFADGLSSTLKEKIMDCLEDPYKERVVSAENLCINWLETRTEKEMVAYNGIVQIAHSMISEAFSSRVIIPGITTNLDVKYFMMQSVIDLGLQPWFDYEVSIIRKGLGQTEDEMVIMPGDILHCDVGLKYMGLCTDTQENAYICHMDEVDAPEYLKKALQQTLTVQDCVVKNMVAGKTGNEILKAARQDAIDMGCKPCIYTHPIGIHGHAAGPYIGLWDSQDGVPFMGDSILRNNTAYSLELNATVNVEEWDMEFQLGLETDIVFTNDTVYYLGGRQEKFHLVK